ncbi:hypothetical protein WICANDRAFT_80804 [Wickerhamomyces anomalus NRRL Y-366-8]|uniref:Uncharacterized protein n=1 Tax=Wickerhamomyces anomalus (strain ATCC 58044 / CBS 1984 / NCYC 433 / NRRL Y-366-8) TaxID=683960 RepID=A0A1E3NWF4_WICAA|nr:uncharacterized protein WICANDRAFT_80804 [Wickerhamomyces anomalus NRRL Y-366-8]ODQ57466.1 hypothetical protein WICANDRAFT_80804 [Wickerhamomyces anomalus NRRL Y-366-8]
MNDVRSSNGGQATGGQVNGGGEATGGQVEATGGQVNGGGEANGDDQQLYIPNLVNQLYIQNLVRPAIQEDELNQNDHHCFQIPRWYSYSLIPTTIAIVSIVLTIVPSTRYYGLVFLFESMIRFGLRALKTGLWEIPSNYPAMVDPLEMFQREMISTIITSFTWLLYYYVFGGNKA